MNEFKILLIDDDDEQEQQLREAVNKLNKNYFIDNIKDIYEITDLKFLAKLKTLDSIGEIINNLKEKDYILNVDTDKDNFPVTFKVAKKPEEAMILLYKEDFHALIIDLKLGIEDNNKEDEDYSGNILLKNIVKKEIIPIIVRTGFPSKFQEINKNIIKSYPKENPPLDKVITELINFYSTSIFSIFGSRGKANEHIKDFFWNVLPECFIDKNEEITDLSKEIQEKVIIRYVSSWLNNKYMFNDGYLDVEPIEMYMFPNPIDKVCNCDIYEDNSTNEKLIVLTPACDLANDKTENILFATIKKYENVENFTSTIAQCCSQYKNETNISNNNKNKIASWARNSHENSMRYHFLPKVSFFDGGFIDFRLLICLKYDKKNNTFEGRDLKKIGTITDSFKRDIIARFSSYYQRQGQPTFNINSILKKFF